MRYEPPTCRGSITYRIIDIYYDFIKSGTSLGYIRYIYDLYDYNINVGIQVGYKKYENKSRDSSRIYVPI